MLKINKPKSEKNDITTLRTSSESLPHWKKHFHKNPLYFRVYADFGADNEKDNSSIGNKTTIICGQNAVHNGYHIKSELEDVLKSGYYKFLLGYKNIDWFVNEFTKLENKMACYFKDTKKGIGMIKKDEEDFKNI